MRAWYSDPYEVPLPEGHRFPMGKYRLVREALLARGVLPAEALELARPLDRRTLALVHEADYLRACFEGTLDEAAQRRIGFPWSEGLLTRSLASAGGTLAAARYALAHGASGNLAGGTHHAHAGFGAGYCVFNDLAVTAAALLSEGRVERVLVVDLDVHQGDGTAAIFRGEPRVFTFSMHGEKNFPFRKQASTRDVELPDGCDDGRYLELLDAHLSEVFEASAPSLVLYQAGVDALKEDTLGRLHLTHEGLRARDRRVFDLCWSRAVPVAVTLGGGYARPIEASVDASVGTWEELRRRFA
ncbi:MAG: histone deacetylase [Myxococcaceae bacterium]|jgi:acetoin utilization deacetylase AcuC-like enzyme|nr:histone deacetylase [Myxococcaceae bacterium]MCA3013998.1 histone deacetylase [Myxococcaceae bacterium]